MSVCSFYKSSYEREYGRKSIKKSESESHLVVSDSLQPHGLHIYSPWNSPGQNTGVGGLFPFPGNLPNPGIKPRSPALQADSLPSELPAKPHDKPILSNNITDKIIIPTLQMRKGAQRGG